MANNRDLLEENTVIDQIINSALSHNLIVVLLGMLPIVELRGALPIGITVFDMPWYQAYCLSVIGNLIPVPLLLLFFGAVAKLVQKNALGKRFIDWLLNLTSKRSARISKYKLAGLTLFVAIPLPVTGAWTASLAAYILGMRFWPSFLAITLGVLAAGVIVTILTLLGWIGAGIAIAALVIIAAIAVWRSH